MRIQCAKTLRILLLSVTASVILAGCSPTPAPPNPVAIAIREASAEQVFKGTLSGEPVFLVAHDCEVFRVQQSTGQAVAWASVLEPEFYPFFTACVRQSLSFDGVAVTATLGRQALGAGGCCATGGTYRSVDGRNWKKL